MDITKLTESERSYVLSLQRRVQSLELVATSGGGVLRPVSFDDVLAAFVEAISRTIHVDASPAAKLIIGLMGHPNASQVTRLIIPEYVYDSRYALFVRCVFN